MNYWSEGADPRRAPMINYIAVDHDFLDTFKVQLQEGRNFSRAQPTGTQKAYILNEAAVKEIGWESPPGKQFALGGKKQGTQGVVIGVVKDFNFESLHKNIEPVAILVNPTLFENIAIKISPDNVPRTLDFLKARWQTLVPDQIFQYSFLANDFNALYKSESRLGKIFTIVSAMAVFIACLGLFGLSAFIIELRKKEIGVRKVLGATVTAITCTLSVGFGKWVILSNLAAWPIAWYLMNRWLQNFAYRIDNWEWIFLPAGFLALVVVSLTISYKVVRAASINPVETLRYE